MKIKSINISNYKSYDDSGVHIHFNNITGFIGANSTGKSNILKAIDLFFNVSKVDEFDFHNKNTEKDIIIDITFSEYGDIKDAEEALLINSNEITLRRVIRWNATKSQGEPDKQLIPVHIWEYKGNVSELNLFPEQRLTAARIRDFKSSVAGQEFHSVLDNNESVFENASNYYEALGQYWMLNYKNDSWNGNYHFTEFQCDNKYKNLITYVNTNIVEKLPEYIYLPIEQTISEELAAKRGTRLEYIFSKLLQYSDAENEKRIKEQNAIERKIEKYYKRFYDKKINQLNNSLNNTDRSFGFSDARLNVQREDLKVDDILEPTIKLMADDGFDSEITTKGTGAQRWAVFQFLQTYADYISKSKDTNIILAIDEPELYLHPPYKRAMYDIFRKLNKTFQIIYTTHDPIFVSLEYFDEIRIIRKNDRINSSINYVDWNDLSRYSDIIPAFKTRKSEGSKRQELFNKCHSEQNEGFFASKIILVEGNTEIYALPIYFKALGFDINQKNISLIAGDGIESLKILYAIFTLFGIPTYVIFDGDKPADLEEREAFYKIHPMANKQYAEILSLLELYEKMSSDENADRLKNKKADLCKIFGENDYNLFMNRKKHLKDIIVLGDKKYDEYCKKFSRNISIHKLFDQRPLKDGFSEFGIYEKYTKWECKFEEDVSKKLDNYSNLSDDAKKTVSGKPLIAKQIALSAVRKGLSRDFKAIMRNLIDKINSLDILGDIPEITLNNPLQSKFKIVLLHFAEYEEKIYVGETEFNKYNIYSCAGGPVNPEADDYIDQAYGIVPDNTDYIIKITGESMEPDIPDNSYLAIEKCENPINNKVHVFYYDGHSICKKYNKGSDGKIRLISINSDVPPIEVNQEPICYGQVICGNDKKPVFLDVVERLD